MQIEIWLDVICPWCYIGKRRFEIALAGFAQRQDVRVIWRSFELDPAAPAQYLETLEEILSRKYRVSPPEAAAMIARVSAAAKSAGLEYHLDKSRTGNTFDAHRLLHHAAGKGRGDRAADCIMHAYFCESLPVGDRSALARLAPGFGITEPEALTVLEGESYAAEVRADEARATALGITSVPFFLIDGRNGISGAQTTEKFVEALYSHR